MPASRFVRLSAVLVVAACALPAAAADPEISHAKPVEARAAAGVDAGIGKIGVAMSLAVLGDRLYVGGAQGVAALDSAGKLLWMLELPPAAARQVAADAGGVAFTSFDVGAVDRTSIAASGLLGGELAAKPDYVNASVGLADAQGKLLWTVPSAEQDKLSPPALAGGVVGVVGAKSFVLYDKAGGKPLGEPLSVFNGFAFTEGLIKQWISRAPVVVDDVFHLARSNVYKRVSAAGKELESNRGGMLSPYEYIPAGPAGGAGRVFFAAAPSGDKKPLLVAAKVGGGVDWDDRMDAAVKTGMFSSYQGAPMDLAVAGDRVFVATNFTVFGYTTDGKALWRAINRGGLVPSALRGGRYIGNAFEQKTPVPRSYLANAFLAATGERVYLASRHTDEASKREDDALTVLDAATGQYVETVVLPEQRILGIAVFGEQLAVLTSTGLKLLALK